MGTTRRDFMRGATALGALPVTQYVAGCGDDEAITGPETMFQHGVASGDPLTDAVMLWTRVSPEGEGEVEVSYAVARDVGVTDIVAEGTQTTGPDHDFTVKVDVTGLEAGTTYYYRFESLRRSSPVGRTRTAPEGGVDRLRFAVMSCSNYAFGHFHAYRHASTRADLDAVIHLGDYIYEYEDGGYGDARELDPPHEILSLEDYRRRYAHYRLDPDLQEVHRQHPFIPIWDDHELTDNAWSGGAFNHDDSEGDFEERKAIAARVYDEWMPIRPSDDGSIFRRLGFGDLLDLVLLDTRIWGREEQSPDEAVIFDPDRTLLGDEQEAWFAEQMQSSEATWCVVGQQIPMGQLKLNGSTLNPDGWDGYEAARTRFFDALRDAGRGNVVVVTGDIHASAAVDLVDDPFDEQVYDPATGDGAVAVEFVTPGVTSPFFAPTIVAGVVADSPHMRWADGENRGYTVIDVTPERIQCDWYLYPDPVPESVDVSHGQGYLVMDGTPHVVAADAEVPAPDDAPELAPA